MKRSIIYRIAPAAMLATFLSAASALEVNRSELQGAGSRTVEFNNYTGPHSVINTADQIVGIGRDLGRNINERNMQEEAQFGTRSRYYLIHAVDSSQKERLDADILVIGSAAAVDHVDNLRRIITGHLMAAYGYTQRDAATIATFVTVYNAVYRGDMDTFGSKYKDVVTKNLSRDIAGLSTNYREWPGRTQIVIPLSDVGSANLSAVDTSVISDKNVIDSMRKDGKKGIDARKNMVDLKEREADDAAKKAQDAQKAATDEKKKLDAQKKAAQNSKSAADKAKSDADKKKSDADKKKSDADKKKADADAARKEAEANPDDSEAQELARQAQEAAEAAQRDADDAKKAADEAQNYADEAKRAAEAAKREADSQQKKSDDASKRATEQQDKADTKRFEAQTDRTDIAKDQGALRQNEVVKNPVLGLRLTDREGLLSTIVMMNGDTGAVVRESPVNVIRGREIDVTKAGLVAVAGLNEGNGAIKLVLLDAEKMEILRESNETLSERSTLVKAGDSYYCVIQEAGKCYVAKYDGNIKLLQKSPVPVLAATPIVVSPNGIVVTNEAGRACLLNAADLTLLSGKKK